MGRNLTLCLSALITGILAGSGILNPAVCIGAGLSFMLLMSFGKCAGFRLDQMITATRSVLLVFVLMGSSGWLSISLNRYTLSVNTDKDHYILAKVVSYRIVNDRLSQVIVEVKREWDQKQWNRSKGRILLLTRPGKTVYRRGDTWELGPLSVNRVPTVAQDNGFNPGRYWLSRGISYQSWLNEGQGRLVRERRFVSVREVMETWQSGTSSRFSRMGLSAASSGLLEAMILGDRKDLDKTVRDQFSRAGIIHVLSVSGLHVGIIYLILKKLFSLVGFKRRRIITSAVSLILVWAYVGLTGSGPSALRAGSMISIFEIAGLMRRNNGGLQVLGATAFIHLVIDPFTLFSAGAQLSYLAVAGIFTWMPVFDFTKKWNILFRKIGGAMAVSVSAQSLIIPPLIFWFGWFPVYFLAGNLVLLPLMVAVFYLGILLLGLDLVGLHPGFLMKLVDHAVAFGTRGAGFLGDLPGNLFEPKGLTWVDLLVYYLLLSGLRNYFINPFPGIPARLLAIAIAGFLLHWIGQ